MGVTQHGRTHRLDLADPTLREWTCTVLHADPEQGIVLDRSAFYPGGGGQPPDHGVLLWQGVQTRIVGTRVASTAQIGKVQVVKVESKGRANRRVRVRLVD
ncbi:alanine--tRNA ligase-related protein [Micromonospora sp. WMMD710]|uniref:alanine--tRNA ligase-related protein n=1 Tax=Micromonospora sp. WMMD710 TaxID=3016085 RepID=UPI002416326B|nr:alanine--tRNA ligase-related protein [Micromonospora sp. WMMD710]MDG4761765.1 alanine--tRNA ligase-related protein [Micromonospora sp. WMMD710]